jgi:hypothetical protein
MPFQRNNPRYLGVNLNSFQRDVLPVTLWNDVKCPFLGC